MREGIRPDLYPNFGFSPGWILDSGRVSMTEVWSEVEMISRWTLRLTPKGRSTQKVKTLKTFQMSSLLERLSW